jgi:hypothetical protein
MELPVFLANDLGRSKNHSVIFGANEGREAIESISTLTILLVPYQYFRLPAAPPGR